MVGSTRSRVVGVRVVGHFPLLVERGVVSETDDPTGADRRRSTLRLLAGGGGAGLAGSYALPWVEVSQSGGDTSATVTGGTGDISAGELELLPELALAVGLLAVVAVAVRWTVGTQVMTVGLGLAGVGLTAYSWSFLGADADLVAVGERVGPPAAFDPGLGLVVAAAGSLVLVGAGFLAAVRELG